MSAGACCHGDEKASAGVADPVCGMSVNPATSKHQASHDGRTFHFCCAGCKARFEAAPATYLEGRAAPIPAATGALYTSSLISLGLILFFITFIVLACAQLMLRSLERQAGTK